MVSSDETDSFEMLYGVQEGKQAAANILRTN